MSSILETTMLICFGLSWPINLGKAYRSRTTKGTSLPFILLITLGYVAGITAKIMTGQINYVLAAYLLNIAIVLMNIAVYCRNRKLDQKAVVKEKSTQSKVTAETLKVLEGMEMNINREELVSYNTLNEMTTGNGIVVFGGTDDRNIPLSELKQAFGFSESIFNRSLTGLSITDARSAYDACVAELNPESLLIHIGDEDIESFRRDEAAFDADYRAFITHVREYRSKCRIAVISIDNPAMNDTITEMNRHLKRIAQSERCEFCDINTMLWTPREAQELAGFIYNTGFESPLNIKRPVYSIARMLFSYQRTNKLKLTFRNERSESGEENSRESTVA